MRIDGKNQWKFKATESDEIITTRILGHSCDNEWLLIRPSGVIVQKASPDHAFSWDGCTPKWSWWDIVFGTPDGRVNPKSGYPMTYRASRFHDALNQFAPPEISRKAIDLVFYDLMKAEGFKPRYVYYFAVRIFGRFFMKDRNP